MAKIVGAPKFRLTARSQCSILFRTRTCIHHPHPQTSRVTRGEGGRRDEVRDRRDANEKMFPCRSSILFFYDPQKRDLSTARRGRRGGKIGIYRPSM